SLSVVLLYVCCRFVPSMCESFSCFFFLCYGVPCDLHSFPTRRSSDLGPDGLTLLQGYVASGHAAPMGQTLGFSLVEVDEGHAVIDRKSTRLNSSHVKISYAVFCLKKKKNCKRRRCERRAQ